MINSYNKKIFICATEQSGDNIGYNIILELLKNNKNIIFSGVGGNKMAPFLKNHYYSLKDFNSMGIIEIFFSLRKYIRMINILVNKILNNRYDLVITIDSPDFNYSLVKKLRKQHFSNKIIHIVAPTVWAWRKNRAQKFSKIFDELLVLFNFEIKYFTKYELKTTLIGHPVYYIKKVDMNKKNLPNIAFLPGSRLSEIQKLFPYFDLAYKYLLKYSPEITIFIPTLPHLQKYIENYIKEWKMKIIISTDKNIIEENYFKTKKALVCSGTASLELAKRNIPQLVIYKFNIFTELIAKNLVNVKYANIINIFKNKMIIPEITNSKLNKKLFLKEFDKLIKDDQANIKQIEDTNNALKEIQTDKPPYLLAANRIMSYL